MMKNNSDKIFKERKSETGIFIPGPNAFLQFTTSVCVYIHTHKHTYTHTHTLATSGCVCIHTNEHAPTHTHTVGVLFS